MALRPCVDCRNNNGDCDYRGGMGMDDDGVYRCDDWKPIARKRDNDEIEYKYPPQL